MTVVTLLPNTDCANSLGEATVNILENAFYLAKQKLELSRKAYKKLIKQWGWENEDKKYLKVNQTFKKFSPQDLAQVEPATIFCLANQNKKYAPVIEKLLDISHITQQTVRELMKQQRKPKLFFPEKPTIWRQTRDGRRYCQVPPIHDQETGVILQRMMDSEGKSAQQIVAESLALRKALQEECLVEVPVMEETENIEVETQEVEVSESKHLGIDNPQTESDKVIVNPTTTQETIEFLSNELFVLIENIDNFGKKEVKGTEELIARIIDFCNIQPIEEQWNTLASITYKDINALAIVIENSGTYHKEWLLNLPRLLADAVLENPEELEWVDKQLRSEALSLISKITAFSAISKNI
ncbi:hypothetical protein NIES267_72880 (plasmid) [Calothrix parasitica NIES-267]|uniref:Uncharacterized protein n=1 Tax=Calothrix parasitica NIES-267 TaxID=1973488 RepID=A0A1Z4M2P1_9CYAN|nr:hypothetical protein NIES267_72880 [Calothrix parasitica NIES-267]